MIRGHSMVFSKGTAMETDDVPPPPLPEVETATLWFMKRDSRFTDEKPYLFTYPLEGCTFPSNLKHEPRDGVVIRNLRDWVPSYTESGIAILNLENGLEHDDYDDAGKVERVLLPKIRESLKLFLKAETVHILEYKLRKRDAAFPKSLGRGYEYSQPAIGAHVDYNAREIKKILEVVYAGDREKWEDKRIQALNLWSPLSGPLRDWPLCVCDSSTVRLDDDLQVADVVSRDSVVENFQLHHSDQQRWYYLKDQMPNEFLIFRATDTARPEFAAVPHCSFQVSEARKNGVRRESIEIRVVALHSE